MTERSELEGRSNLLKSIDCKGLLRSLRSLAMTYSGFTFLELIIVIAIISILAVAAISAFNVPQKDLDTVSKALRSNLQLAQEMAMTYNNIYGFRSISTTSYEIYIGAPGTPAVNPLTRGSFIVNISPVQFSGTVPVVPFQTSGQPNIGANASILLAGGGGTRTITVQQSTGFVTIGP